MNIDAIDLYLAALPLKRPHETDFGPIDKLETEVDRIWTILHQR